MKYQIHGFQQSEALRLGINDRDLLYLRWYIDFKGTEKMVCHTINGTHFYWVNYQALIDDHPCLEVKSRETISRRFNKMVESGILIKYLKKDKKGTYTLFAIGPEYLSLADSKKVECKELAPDIFVESNQSAPDKKVDPKDPNTNNIHPNTNIQTSPDVEVKKPKPRSPESQKAYDDKDKFIEYLKYKHNYEIIPDKKFDNMFFPKLKLHGIDKLILVIDNYFSDVKVNGKFAGTMDSIFYQPFRFAKYANMNKQESINDEERVQAILANRKKFEGLNDTRKR